MCLGIKVNYILYVFMYNPELKECWETERKKERKKWLREKQGFIMSKLCSVVPCKAA